MSDNPVTALSYDYWVRTMNTLQAHPSSNEATKQLAGMCQRLMEINRHDPETIKYLNAEGARAMNEGRNGH
jgi:hypothetical protein